MMKKPNKLKCCVDIQFHRLCYRAIIKQTTFIDILLNKFDSIRYVFDLSFALKAKKTGLISLTSSRYKRYNCCNFISSYLATQRNFISFFFFSKIWFDKLIYIIAYLESFSICKTLQGNIDVVCLLSAFTMQNCWCMYTVFVTSLSQFNSFKPFSKCIGYDGLYHNEAEESEKCSSINR